MPFTKELETIYQTRTIATLKFACTWLSIICVIISSHRRTGTPLSATRHGKTSNKDLEDGGFFIFFVYWAKGFCANCIILPAEHHGCARGRRRETAIMASMIIGYALRQLNCSYVDSFKDMANAFPSVGWQYMEKAAAALVRGKDLRLALQRIRRAQARLPAAEGTLHFRPTEGGLMGGPFMAHCFPRAFTHTIEPWTQQWRRTDNADKVLVVKCPITHQDVDLSLHLYADDINKKISQHMPTQKEDVNLDTLRG
eukprot:971385-Pyramimonas_sp.AAC.1